MNAPIDTASDDYFSEAHRWDTDRVAGIERSRRIAWRTAAAGWLCAVAGSVALALLMPLKRVDPFVIRVDNTTGVVDVVPSFTTTASIDETVTRYFLGHYVTTCERFNAVTVESDYEECGAFHGPQRNLTWAALWKTTNPESPLNLYRDGSRIRAEVQSISFFKRSSGMTDLAQVRYIKSVRQASDSLPRITRWIATIQYRYGPPSTEPRQRAWNPLGFRVVEFNTEPEVPASEVQR
jgi:type IV secretion system protein VirB8